MKKRFFILIGLLVAGFLGLLVWLGFRPAEPSFEGRVLRSWLDHHVASSAANPPYNSPGWKKADEAIRHIGTNGIPTLLEMLRAKEPPPVVIKLRKKAEQLGLTRTRYRHATTLNEEAEYAFEMLGTNAVSAVPELIRIYEADVSPSSQECAAQALGHIRAGARAALPALIQRFTHTNDDVRFYAVSAVCDIGGDPAVLIPAFRRALKASNLNVRWNALNGLMHFGRRASVAVPDILPMLSDRGMLGSSSMTQQVEYALWQIAPEKVGKILVVEDATPMITNGVTAQALKAFFFGKRTILIPAGRTVPTLGQYWNSDPRPKLTLYRGDSASDENDHFLGDFEVLDLPEEENINISTLCMIADGQVILSARDSSRRMFLPLRRVDANNAK